MQIRLVIFFTQPNEIGLSFINSETTFFQIHENCIVIYLYNLYL